MKKAKKAPAAPRIRVTPELARQRLKERHGYTDDEIDVLWPKDADLVRAYADIKNNLNADAQIAGDQADDFDLPEEDKALIAEESRRDADAKAHMILSVDPSSKVTAEELTQTQRDLQDLLTDSEDL